ncbi:hypothetical protein FGO68_gene3266 [Halteria grandinella]|uniref:Transmembrane protein n=1 Tax=Halteria grandinella TaxID=5974 RepID=A0A8J8NZW1_HALGN|nr:hypothetical protein FGO68_gene3266 [Halteria grandinella]
MNQSIKTIYPAYSTIIETFKQSISEKSIRRPFLHFLIPILQLLSRTNLLLNALFALNFTKFFYQLFQPFNCLVKILSNCLPSRVASVCQIFLLCIILLTLRAHYSDLWANFFSFPFYALVLQFSSFCNIHVAFEWALERYPLAILQYMVNKCLIIHLFVKLGAIFKWTPQGLNLVEKGLFQIREFSHFEIFLTKGAHLFFIEIFIHDYAVCAQALLTENASLYLWQIVQLETEYAAQFDVRTFIGEFYCHQYLLNI